MWWWSDTAHLMITIIRFLSITCLFIHQQYVHNRYHIIILLRFINNSSLKEDWHPLRCKVFSRFHMVLYLYPQLQYTIEICSRNKGLQFFQLLCDGGEKTHLMDSEMLIALMERLYMEAQDGLKTIAPPLFLNIFFYFLLV